MKAYYFLILSFCSLLLAELRVQREKDYDHKKTIAEYIMGFGFQYEEHKVITEDGYILTLFRIPRKIGQRNNHSTPIFLLAGLFDTAFTFLFKSTSEKNLAFLLALQGYDVWIGNNRGTTYSTEHINKTFFNWEDPDGMFWDFSVDEMGKYDVPAMLDYISEITGYEKFPYIGHSQGTVQFHVLSMLNPEYVNKRISSYVGLSPIVYINHMKGLFEKIFVLTDIPKLLKSIGIKNMWVTPFLTPLQAYIIQFMPIIPILIFPIITGGAQIGTIDINRMPVFVKHEPGGSSAQNLMFYIQNSKKERLTMFDFGPEMNMIKYNRTNPPRYQLENLKKLNFPKFFVLGEDDNIVSKVDYEKFLLLVNNYEEIRMEGYGHIDCIWRDNANIFLYPHILEFLKTNAINS